MSTTQEATPAAPPYGGAPQQEEPLGSYALLTTVFNAAFVGALVAGRRRLPERFAAADLALMAVGTHKLSRVIARDKVTATIRAPFAATEGKAGPAEVDSRPVGRGLRRALGELLVCPYCLDQWVAGSYVAGMIFAPRATRAIASMFTVVAGADVLQHGYRVMQEQA